MLGKDRKSEISCTGGRNGFLAKSQRLSLVDKVKNIDIYQSLNIELLLLRIERSQLHWYGHVTRMSHEQTANQKMDALPMAKGLEGDPEVACEIMLKT